VEDVNAEGVYRNGASDLMHEENDHEQWGDDVGVQNFNELTEGETRAFLDGV